MALAIAFGPMTKPAFGPQYTDLVVFSLLVSVLVLRPRGLLGKQLPAAG